MHLSMLESGNYIGVLPHSLLWFGRLRGGIKVLPVKFEGKPPPVGYATLKHRTVGSVAKLFIDELRTIARRGLANDERIHLR
jgi:DNA-binding transcriptional LysR family regulator